MRYAHKNIRKLTFKNSFIIVLALIIFKINWIRLLAEARSDWHRTTTILSVN